MAKKREGQQQAAFEAGTRNVLPGQAYVEALGRGLLGELFGADMGTPVGQKLREEIGSVGYENALREMYPEDFAMGRATGSEIFDPLTLFAMRARGRAPAYTGEVLPPMRVAPTGARAAGPIMEGRATGPGLSAPPPAALEDMAVRSGPPRNVPMSPPRTGYEQNMMGAYYRNVGGGEYGPYVPGARSGFAYRPEHMRRTSDMLQPEPGYVDLEVVRNPQEFYNQGMEDFLAAQMRAGNRDIMRHEYYGRPSGMRPNYGEVPEGYVSPFERMPRPGVGPRTQAPEPFVPGMREPYGVGGEGRGYFGELPRPGIEPRGGRGPDGFTGGEGPIAGVPVGRGGVPMAGGNTPTMQGQIPYSPRLPVMAGGGRNLVPTEIPGEFYEAYGLPGPGPAGRYSMPPMSGPGPSPAAMMAAGSRMPYVAPVAAVGGFGLGAGMFSRQPPVTTPLGGGDVQNVLMAAPLSMGPEYGGAIAQRGTPTVAGAGRSLEATRGPVTPKGQKEKRGKQIFPTVNVPARVPVPPRRPEELGAEQGFEPNLNYLVTQAIDRLVGQGEAERGRKYQQDVEEYQRKYGPIYY